MSREARFHLFLAIILLFSVSCSGGDRNPGEPPMAASPVLPEADIAPGNTTCLGIWQVMINQEAGTIEAVDMRSSDLIINVLRFLEPPAMSGMKIDFSTLNIDAAHKKVEVDVILAHPIPDPAFMGFDVRGVVFGPKVTNADGLTVIPSPEYFKGVPFGYKDGLLGVPDKTANYEGLAGYKYFCDGLGKDDDLVAFMSNPANLANRGVFSQSPKKNTRHYVLDWNDVAYGFFVFNYAVYANYDCPSGSPPIDINDFDINTANSAEAFCAKITELGNYLWYSGGTGGGKISLKVEAWDWQGDIADVTIQSVKSGIIANTSFSTYLGAGSTSKSYVYEFNAVPGTPTATGDLDILITVTDEHTFGECWLMGLLSSSHTMYAKPVYNCWIHTATVSSSYAGGWARTWGGTDLDNGLGAATDGSGDIYVTGNFYGSNVDFDPGTGTDYHSSKGLIDVFLSKSDSDGDFEWARTWGGTNNEYSDAVTTDGSGNIYVAGDFQGSDVDFDPGSGTDFHSSNGAYDVFLTKFDSDGNFKWALTWGGTDTDSGGGVATDGSGSIYVTGCFQGSNVDFDPGPGTDSHSSIAFYDVFLTKFDSDGNFKGALTWGGKGDDRGNGVAMGGSGNIYVCGTFFGLDADFDPGTGTDNHSSNGADDVFLSKFDSGGNFKWARTWGGLYNDCGRVTTDGSGDVYLTGYFYGSNVDFDPGTGTDNHSSNGQDDVFLSKFDSDGNFKWAHTWGGTDYDSGGGVATDGSGNIYVTGSFRSSNVDFDPGPGTDYHSPTGSSDVLLSRFDSAGNFEWARTFGGKDSDGGGSVATDGSGSIYVSGHFVGSNVDFDPGPGTDYHSSNGSGDVFLSKFLPDGYW